VKRTPVVIFGVLVAATFAAFFVAQRLKNAPSVVQRFQATYVFSPNRDGRYDRAHVTFRIKKADDVTVELVNRDGDPVKTLMDDRHLAAYTPIEPSLSWDGTDDDGKVVPDGLYRVRITLRHLGRTVIPQRSILKDTKPPQPKVLSIGPEKAYGPELLPEPDGAPATIHFGLALYQAKIMIFRTAPGRPRLVRTANLDAKSQKRPDATVTSWSWDGTNDAGRRVSPGTYLVVLQWRDKAGNIGSSVPLDRAGLPILTRGKLPGRGGITVRYLGAQTPVGAIKARDRVQIQVDARQQRYSWNVRRLGDQAIRAHSTKSKTKTKVVFSAPGGKSGLYVFTAHTSPSRGPRPSRTASSSSCPTSPGRAATRSTTTATARPTRSTSAARRARCGPGPATASRRASPSRRASCCAGWTPRASAMTSRPTWRSTSSSARSSPATTAC
jgi:hypothetical protein